MNKPGMAAKNGFIGKKSRDFQPVSKGEMRFAAGPLTFDLASAAPNPKDHEAGTAENVAGKPATCCETMIVGLLFRNAMMMQ
jgi:hypothetical protein